MATIDRAQEILFSPINWILEILPTWLMVVISIALLGIFVLTLITHQFHLSIIDGVLLLISIILIIWGDPYSETRESMKDQIEVYYKNKINDELIHLNDETNKYYDGLLQTLNFNVNSASSRKSSGMQTGIKTNDGRNNRTNFEKDNERNYRTGNKSSSEDLIEADNSERNETLIPEGD